MKHSDARVKKSKQGWLYLALVVGADGGLSGRAFLGEGRKEEGTREHASDAVGLPAFGTKQLSR